MADDHIEQPQPSAEGTLAKTPFPHLLVYAHDRQLTGTMGFAGPTGETATVLFLEGFPAKVRTSEAVSYLGRTLLDTGVITESALNFSLRRLAEEKRLHGQILLEAGSITQEQLVDGLRAQLNRKLLHLARLPPDATFAYYDAFDGLVGYGGDDDSSVDPYPIIWSAIREEPSWEHVHTALTRIGSAGIIVSAAANTNRFALQPAEQAVVDLLRARAWRIHDLTGAGALAPRLTQLLVYCLLITKQVELVPEAQVEPVVATPSVVPEPPPTNPQTVARVQLQALPKSRPAVVEQKADGLKWDQRLTPPSIKAQGPLAQSRPASREDPVYTKPTVPAMAAVTNAAIAEAVLKAQGGGRAKPPVRAGIAAKASTPPVEPVASAPAQAAPVPVPAPAAAPEAKASASPDLAVRRQEILDRVVAIDGQNYFEMLGIARDTTPEQATAAFFALAKTWHPDRVPVGLADVRDACGRVFAHMSEAHQTLIDKEKRARYMTLLRDGGATPETQAEIVRVLDAATNFQKAEICMKRNDLAQAEELCRKAIESDGEQADYQALLAWLEALKPANQAPDKTLALIQKLGQAIKMNPNCERAHFYRGMLHKRIQREHEAIVDFRKAFELNPRNIDAQREVRLSEMRGGSHGSGPQSTRGKPEEKGGLFGKLFKKS